MNCRSKEQEEEYEVEKILDKRTRNGKVEYFLKWLDYSESESTWEPEEYLNCEELIKDFEEKVKQEKKRNQPEYSHKRILSISSNLTVIRFASSDAGPSKKRKKTSLRKKKAVKSNEIEDNDDDDNALPPEK